MASIKGTNGNDILTGTSGNDTIYGKRGDDMIHTGDGDDFAFGGGGHDVLVFSSGNDHFKGGGGRDVFTVVDGASGLLTIDDWTDGKDMIDLSDFGVTSINDLTISSSGGDVTISVGAVQIDLAGVGSAASLSADDFVFAAAPPDPGPGPIPPGATFYDFQDMMIFSNPDFSVPQTGTAIIDWNGFSGWNDSNTGAPAPGSNGYLVKTDNGIYGDPFARETMSATQNFDLESLSLDGVEGATAVLVGFDDGVEIGRQSVTLGADWTSVQLDDAIFNSVDEVEFLGNVSVDDVLILM